jgi:RimJ/RimL family protein N-acetyltransferase
MRRSPAERATVLREVADEDFAWMLCGEPACRRGLTLPPGGVDDPRVLTHVREITNRLHAQGSRGAWMIVSGDEVVGLCGYHHAPTNGAVEIGYSIAGSRRRRGHATRAVEAMVAQALVAGVRLLIAETAVANLASSRVLERNGFLRAGTRIDVEDGAVLAWQKILTR